MKLIDFVIVMVVTMLIGALLVDIGNSTSNTKPSKRSVQNSQELLYIVERSGYACVNEG